jgi:hypothetical protein
MNKTFTHLLINPFTHSLFYTKRTQSRATSPKRRETKKCKTNPITLPKMSKQSECRRSAAGGPMADKTNPISPHGPRAPGHDLCKTNPIYFNQRDTLHASQDTKNQKRTQSRATSPEPRATKKCKTNPIQPASDEPRATSDELCFYLLLNITIFCYIIRIVKENSIASIRF